MSRKSNLANAPLLLLQEACHRYYQIDSFPFFDALVEFPLLF